VIPDHYWILRDKDQKVGNIEIDNGTYVVNIKGRSNRFPSLKTLHDKVQIDFEPAVRRTQNSEPVTQVHGYHTNQPAYNAIFDVRHQLPLWTSEERSRSWLAAGWYLVRQHRDWRIMECPKLILMQRYQYQGPFHTRQQAEQA
jgi:hypothetical protein